MEELIKDDEFRQLDLLLASHKRNEIIEMRGGVFKGTLLHVSARHDKLEMTKRLVETGVDVNWTDGWEWTFAHYASWYGSVTCATYVCQHWPHLLHLQTIDGWTCLHCAVRKDHLPSVRVLLEHNVDVHVRNKRGRTPLDVAKRDNKRHLVKELEKVSFVFSS